MRRRSILGFGEAVYTAGLVFAVLGMSTGIVDAESTSRLMGRITDPSDRAVPDVDIVVRNSATLVEQTVTSNSEGMYEIPILPVGTYRMQVRAKGFRLYD